MAIIEMLRSNRGSKRLANALYLSVSTVSSRDEIVFSLRKDVVKELRWAIGDNIKIIFDDETHLVTLTRTLSNKGYTLCGRSKNTRVDGMIAGGSIRVRARGVIKHPELTAITKDDCVINGPSITFVMPGQS